MVFVFLFLTYIICKYFLPVFRLHWVFVAGRIFSSCGEQGLQVGSVLVAWEFSCPVAYGIFLDQGSYLYPLQVGS